MTLYVDRLQTLRAEVPGDPITAAIVANGAKGWQLVTILPLNDEILVVWDKGDSGEPERATNEPQAEQR